MDLISRKVIVLIADHDTQLWLRSFADAAGFDLATDYDGNPRSAERFDFHATLVASANEVFVPETQHMIAPVRLTAASYGVLGKDREVPVLKLAPDDRLAMMREFFVATYGIEPTFADFKPHISLSYAWSGSPALDDLGVPERELVFDQLRVKTLGGPKPEKRRPALITKRARGAHAVYG